MLSRAFCAFLVLAAPVTARLGPSSATNEESSFNEQERSLQMNFPVPAPTPPPTDPPIPEPQDNYDSTKPYIGVATSDFVRFDLAKSYCASIGSNLASVHKYTDRLTQKEQMWEMKELCEQIVEGDGAPTKDPISGTRCWIGLYWDPCPGQTLMNGHKDRSDCEPSGTFCSNGESCTYYGWWAWDNGEYLMDGFSSQTVTFEHEKGWINETEISETNWGIGNWSQAPDGDWLGTGNTATAWNGNLGWNVWIGDDGIGERCYPAGWPGSPCPGSCCDVDHSHEWNWIQAHDFKDVGVGYATAFLCDNPDYDWNGTPSTEVSQVMEPSAQPSEFPSGTPSTLPTRQPSEIPSGTPSTMPSTEPSTEPSQTPSIQPSATPQFTLDFNELYGGSSQFIAWTGLRAHGIAYALKRKLHEVSSDVYGILKYGVNAKQHPDPCETQPDGTPTMFTGVKANTYPLVLALNDQATEVTIRGSGILVKLYRYKTNFNGFFQNGLLDFNNMDMVESGSLGSACMEDKTLQVLEGFDVVTVHRRTYGQDAFLQGLDIVA